MTARKKKAAKKPTRKGGKKPTPKRTTLAVGDTIERTFKGKTYRLTVIDDGFRVGKTTHRSLTAAAKAITGYAAISGPRFWRTDGGA